MSEFNFKVGDEVEVVSDGSYKFGEKGVVKIISGDHVGIDFGIDFSLGHNLHGILPCDSSSGWYCRKESLKLLDIEEEVKIIIKGANTTVILEDGSMSTVTYNGKGDYSIEKAIELATKKARVANLRSKVDKLEEEYAEKEKDLTSIAEKMNDIDEEIIKIKDEIKAVKKGA